MARLFHSLVVCGAGLTLVHCGGRSASHPGEGGADETSGSSSGSTAGNGAGGGSAQGASAGALNLGGDVNVPGGGSSAGEPSEPMRPAGPTEQWGCDASGATCRGGRFNVHYRSCAFDATRPRAPADCADGEVFSCLQGYLDQETVLFNCACIPMPAAGCACPEVLDNCGARPQAPEMCGGISECGCAITCILK